MHIIILKLTILLKYFNVKIYKNSIYLILINLLNIKYNTINILIY